MKNLDRRCFLVLAGRIGIVGGVAPAVSLVLSGCTTMEKFAVKAAETSHKAGFLSEAGVAAVKRDARAVSRTFEDITPEQEYYIGRAVSANILTRFKPWNNKQATRYVNVLGQTLAQASDMPETYGGYHFLILDSETINAFAAPGGFVFVTRGMLQCCTHEDAAAAVLAHEIGHVQHKHGLQSIKKSRITSALTLVALVGASAVAGEQMGQLSSAFEGSIFDTTTALINKGYSRSFEREADQSAVTILRRVGYSTGGLMDMLAVMQERLKPGGPDFAKTHPSPASRMSDLKKSGVGAGSVQAPKKRQARFVRALGKV